MEDDPMSLIDAEMSRLKGLVRVTERERDEARASLNELAEEHERLQARAEVLQSCLTQARIVLEHLAQNLPNQGDRRLAHGAMVASDMHLTDERVAIRKHLATHPLPGMDCDGCPSPRLAAPTGDAGGVEDNADGR